MSVRQIFNFNSGPSMLPPEVRQQAHEEFFNWRNLGVSVMEVSHRSAEFLAFIEETLQDCRDLLNLPSNYRILFLGGGARGQFAAIPMNLTAENNRAAYLVNGLWGKIAAEEAQRYAKVDIIADSSAQEYRNIPPVAQWKDFSKAAYLHYTENETVHGIEFPSVPDSGKTPLICDMSSSIFSRPLDVSQFGLIYAGAQKNIGIAGITLVIIREDLLARPAQSCTPSIFNYALQVKNNSLYNTPPTFPWYVAGLVFKWLKRQGGLPEMGRRNQRKAAKLYDYIDHSGFYQNPVDPAYRSRMNVIFTLPDAEKEQLFLKAAKAAGLMGLKGHSSLGGMRASLYNAMPEAGVDALIQFMQTFAKQHG